MMIAYVLKRMLRTPLPCIAAVMITFAFTLILGRLTAAIHTQNTQLEVMYDNMKINCVFADPKGKTDNILITNTVIDVCFSENYKLSAYIDDPLFKRSLTYRTGNKDALLVGVNSNRLDDRLRDLQDSGFTGSDYVAFVNEHSGYQIGDTVNLTVRLDSMYEDVKFTVAGVYPGEESDTIYCPWNVVCELAIRLGGQVSAESGSFTLADNHRLTEFKTMADEYFDKVDVSGNGISRRLSGVALVIHDDEFRRVTSATMRNIKMLETLMPFFFLLSFGLGFLVSFLLTRNRYQEFNLMRRVGVKPTVIVAVTLFEQALLALAGIGFGSVFVREVMVLALFLCFVTGSFVSSLLVFRKSVLGTRGE
jgi:hypothetical protein